MPGVRETLRIRTFFLLFLLLFFLPTPFYYKLQTKGYAVVAAAPIHSTPFFLFSLSLLACFVCVFVYESMIPTYRYSVSSPMPIDLNEDHTHHVFSTSHQASSSSSSLSFSILFNPDHQGQGGSCCHWESKHLQSDEEVMHTFLLFLLNSGILVRRTNLSGIMNPCRYNNKPCLIYSYTYRQSMIS